MVDEMHDLTRLVLSGTLVSDSAQCLLEPGLRIGGDRFQCGPAGDGHHELRVEGGDQCPPVVIGADDDVAGQQQPEVRLDLQALSGERGVAGAEDDLRGGRRRRAWP